VKVHGLRQLQPNQLTPLSRVIYKKFIISKLVKKLAACYGSQRSVYMFIRGYHMCLS